VINSRKNFNSTNRSGCNSAKRRPDVQLYSITGWECFETCETRKVVALRWWPKPNKHDGLGFRRLAQQRDRVELYCAWTLIGDVASRTPRPETGTLIRNGRPLTAEDLSLMTGFPESIFEKAFSFFTRPELGWLTVTEFTPENAPNGSAAPVSNPAEPEATAASPSKSGQSPGSPGESPAVVQVGKGGIEGRESRSKPPPPKFKPVPDKLYRREYEAMLKDCDVELKRIQDNHDNYDRTMSKEARELVAFLMKEKGKDWEARVREIQEKPENYIRTKLTQEAQAVTTAWRNRKAEIRNTMNGVT
jgi:hypothetical protein